MAPQTTSHIPIVVREIESRVEQLIADHKRLTELNSELIQQRNSLQASKQEMQERITKLERELTMAQLKAGLKGNSPRGNTRARAYINRLLREVDNCIALLSSPEATEEVGEEGEEVAEVREEVAEVREAERKGAEETKEA